MSIKFNLVVIRFHLCTQKYDQELNASDLNDAFTVKCPKHHCNSRDSTFLSASGGRSLDSGVLLRATPESFKGEEIEIDDNTLFTWKKKYPQIKRKSSLC